MAVLNYLLPESSIVFHTSLLSSWWLPHLVPNLPPHRPILCWDPMIYWPEFSCGFPWEVLSDCSKVDCVRNIPFPESSCIWCLSLSLQSNPFFSSSLDKDLWETRFIFLISVSSASTMPLWSAQTVPSESIWRMRYLILREDKLEVTEPWLKPTSFWFLFPSASGPKLPYGKL